MKLLFAASLVVVVAAAALNVINAAPNSINSNDNSRDKRYTTFFGDCPRFMDDDQCLEYAMNKLKDVCARINVFNSTIDWASCGVTVCRIPNFKEGDPIKPYPECCNDCVKTENRFV